MEAPIQVTKRARAPGLQKPPEDRGREQGQVGGSALKFVQLKNHLLEQLRSGRLGVGTEMPSELTLAKEFGISRGTVRRALSEMEQEGLIRREKGRGTFVSDDVQVRSRVATGTFVLILKRRDPTVLPFIHGFEEVCQSMGHDMVFCNSKNDINLQAELILRLGQRDISGVAILPVNSPPTPTYHITTLQDWGVPVVFCFRRPEDSKGPMVTAAVDDQVRLIEKAFLENGHRRVALVDGDRTDNHTKKWVHAVRDHLQAADVELPEDFIFVSESTSGDPAEFEKDLPEKLEKMLSSENPPTAILATSDVFAQTVQLDLERMGFRVPQDISLIGMGGTDRHGTFLRRLTSLVNDGVDAGRRTVELLAQMEAGQRDLLNSEDIVVPLSLSDGQTLGPAPKTPVRYCPNNNKVIRA